jgi:ferredoxin
MTLRVHVDSEKCQGHNRCYALAPDLFDVDDLGFATERGAGEVPPELEGQARAAVANCPEFAISITESM